MKKNLQALGVLLSLTCAHRFDLPRGGNDHSKVNDVEQCRRKHFYCHGKVVVQADCSEVHGG